MFSKSLLSPRPLLSGEKRVADGSSPKFWWLDKSQNSLKPCESSSPLPKGAIFLSANGCGVDQHTKAHTGLQVPSSLQVPVRHFRVHASILALLISPCPKLHPAPSSTHSLSCKLCGFSCTNTLFCLHFLLSTFLSPSLYLCSAPASLAIKSSLPVMFSLLLALSSALASTKCLFSLS